MNEIEVVQQQLTRLAMALGSGALVIFAILAFTANREEGAREILYDYHLASESAARALYAADARMRNPLGLQELDPSHISDLYTYVSNVLVEYEIMRKQADIILALDREYANPLTAKVVERLRVARDELEKLAIENSSDSTKAAMLIADNELEIGLVSEQLFRIHRGAFLQKRKAYSQQRELGLLILLLVLTVVCGLAGVYWSKNRRAIAESMIRERAAVQASVHAEQSSIAKSDFLARMSHELRTPLNSILGFGQLMKRDHGHALSGQQEHYVNEILSAGSHLLDLVNEVLDLDLIERGKIRLDVHPVAVAPELEACVQQLLPAIKQSELDVRLGVSEEHQVQADQFRLRQILLNLLSNAIKYNNQGGEIRVWSTAVSDNRLRINVQDSGPGISGEEQKRLFNAFERVGTHTNKVEGAGIGLALSKQLVTMMNGVIGLESLPGQGSTFWFELPLAEETDPA